MYNHPYLLQGYSAERQLDRQLAARRAGLALSARKAGSIRESRETWAGPVRFFGRFSRRTARFDRGSAAAT